MVGKNPAVLGENLAMLGKNPIVFEEQTKMADACKAEADRLLGKDGRAA